MNPRRSRPRRPGHPGARLRAFGAWAGSRARNARASASTGGAATRLRAVLTAVLLALCFGSAQQTATLHWLSHSLAAVAGQTSPDTRDAGTGRVADHCDECLLLAAFAAAAPAPVSSLPIAGPGTPEDVQPLPIRRRGPPALAYRSRAPPVLS